MALVRLCQQCNRLKVIDTHCGDGAMICFDCFDSCWAFNHKPDCRVAITRRIKKIQGISVIHDLIAKQKIIITEADNNERALENTLREIDPCSECHAQLRKMACKKCGGTGYNPQPTKDELNKEAPPSTY
ncbi:MAG: hypothetical protein AAB969_00370 [Patescibacteria group bacterium]